MSAEGQAVYSFDASHKDVRRHAASGFIYSGVTQVVRLVTQFVSVAVMARLLTPSDFGLVAMAAPVYSFALMFNNLGLNQATIQKPHLSTDQVNSFFWLSTFVSLAVGIFLMVFSPVVGWFYHEPRTTALVIAMAFLVPLSGLGNQHGALMIRKLEFRAQAIINIASLVFGLITAVLCGIIFRNYWSLYFGMAVGSLISLVGVWGAVQWRPGRPAWAPEAGEMLRYGLRMTGGNLVYFITGNITSVVIGRELGERLLGLYDRANKLLSAPLQQATVPVSNMIVPLLCQIQDDEDRYRRTFLRAIASIMLLIGPGVMWAVGLPDALVGTLMGPKWAETTPIFAALSLAALPQLINDSAGWLISSQGRSKDYARWSLFQSVLTLAAFAIGLPFGVVGVARAAAASQFLRTPFLWWFACRQGPVTLRHVGHALTPQIVGCLGVYAALVLLRSLWPFDGLSLLGAGLGVAYVVALGCVALFPSGRQAIVRDFGFIKYMLRRIGSRSAPASPDVSL